MMHFRNKSIADSVVERITDISKSIRGVAPPPAPRGAATVALERQADGGLMVTKTFENGETELLTINTQVTVPSGFVDITPQEGAEQVGGEPAAPAAGGQDIVQAAALGGDSLDTLLG